MKEHPILFSTPMVQALLEGRKTMTRRVVKPQPPDDHPFSLCDARGCCAWGETGDEGDGWWPKDGAIRCPYGTIGDRLWVRETFTETTPTEPLNRKYVYKTDYDGIHNSTMFKWKPSIFMPRAASRIMLEITNVRVERLNGISDQDATAEGVSNEVYRYDDWKHHVGKDWMAHRIPLMNYAHLWESINGKGSWKENPWIWIIEFKRITL
jgi:hypothetical protein